MAGPRRRSRSEHRAPTVFSLLVALALYLFVPGGLHSHVRLVVVALELLALVLLLTVNPVRLRRQTRVSRIVALVQTLILTAATLLGLGELVVQLVTGPLRGQPLVSGPRLLLAALQLWIAVVLAFSLLYWQLDRGGAVRRRHADRRPAGTQDFRFAQDADVEVEHHAWSPSYIDYLVLSLTNATAFTPSRTVPLTARAKVLVSVQSFAGFVLIGVVVIRSVVLLA